MIASSELFVCMKKTEMEGNPFLRLLLGSGDEDPMTNNSATWDDGATFNAMFPGVSLHSFLSGHHQFPLTLLLSHPDGYASSTSDLSPRLPKSESFSDYQDYFPTQTHNDMNTNPNQLHDYSSIFHHLPDLLSLDPSNNSSSSSSSTSSYKRTRLDSSPYSRFLPSIPDHPNHCILPSYAAPPPPALNKVRCGSTLARLRRQTLSDKTRCLQRLLPWDKKMDTATMLKEAYKYVKFLQAQLTALQAMPTDALYSSSTSSPSPIFPRGTTSGPGDVDIEGAVMSGLSRLSRNQLLQVLVNSPVAQTRMYSQGCCVFAVEQLPLLNHRIRSSAHVLHHFFLDSSSPNN